MFLISKGFIHCTSHDGTFRSICMDCFVTVSSKQREEDLMEPEQKHICEPWMLENHAGRRKDGELRLLEEQPTVGKSHA